MKKNLMVVGVAAAVAVGVGGATAFLMARTQSTNTVVLSKNGRLPIDAKARYVSLDKLIVMLRGTEGSPRPRYLVVDLVFSAADGKREKQVREQLPVLRAAAYRALAERTPADMQRMGPVELAVLLRTEYEGAYGGNASVPFDQVMVTKVMMD